MAQGHSLNAIDRHRITEHIRKRLRDFAQDPSTGDSGSRNVSKRSDAVALFRARRVSSHVSKREERLAIASSNAVLSKWLVPCTGPVIIPRRSQAENVSGGIRK